VIATPTPVGGRGSRIAWWMPIALVGMLIAPATSRAFTITASFDTSITNYPQAANVIATINTAIAQYSNKISDPINVTITFQRKYTGLGGSFVLRSRITYASYLAALRSHAGSTDDAIALGHVPGGPSNGVNGNDSVYVQLALGRALGFGTIAQPGPPDVAVSVVSGEPGDPRTSPGDPQSIRRELTAGRAALLSPASTQASPDGVISLNLDPMNVTTNPTPPGEYSLFAVASHEIDEVLGSSSALTNLANGAPAPTGPIYPEDLFRYDVQGVRSFNTSATDSAYFSLDGTTQLVRYNQNAGGDFSDWYSPGGTIPHTPRVQDAFQTPGADPVMAEEWRLLDAVGYNFGSKAVWVDFMYGGGTQTGEFATPYPTIAQGIAAVPVGGVILIKGNGGHTPELPTVTQPMTITTVGGYATIGQ
jgi:hypothetical protein